MLYFRKIEIGEKANEKGNLLLGALLLVMTGCATKSQSTETSKAQPLLR